MKLRDLALFQMGKGKVFKTFHTLDTKSFLQCSLLVMIQWAGEAVLRGKWNIVLKNIPFSVGYNANLHGFNPYSGEKKIKTKFKRMT